MPDELSNDIVRQLLQLPYEQRDQLANTLINSLHPEGEDVGQDEWKSAWIEECHRRVAEIDSGDVFAVKGDAVDVRQQHLRLGIGRRGTGFGHGGWWWILPI